MKNKGFVMIETIVVITIMTVGLIALFTSYSLFLSKSSIKSTHDNAAYIYPTFFAKEYLRLNGNRHIPGSSITTYDVSSPTIESGIKKIMENLKIQKIYIIPASYSYTTLLSSVKTAFDGSSLEYVRAMKANYTSGSYHIICKFVEEDVLLSTADDKVYIYNFASLEY